MKDASIAVPSLPRIQGLYRPGQRRRSLGSDDATHSPTKMDQSQTIQALKNNAKLDDSFLITSPPPAMAPTPHAEKQVHGHHISFNKRYSNGWMLHADYTYSQAKGNQPTHRPRPGAGVILRSRTDRSTPTAICPMTRRTPSKSTERRHYPWALSCHRGSRFRAAYNWTRYVCCSSISESHKNPVLPRTKRLTEFSTWSTST